MEWAIARVNLKIILRLCHAWYITCCLLYTDASFHIREDLYCLETIKLSTEISKCAFRSGNPYTSIPHCPVAKNSVLEMEPPFTMVKSLWLINCTSCLDCIPQQLHLVCNYIRSSSGNFVIWGLIYDYRFLTMPFDLYHLVPNATAWSNRVSSLCAFSNINWGTIWPHSKHLLVYLSLFQSMNTLQTTKRGALNSGKIAIFRKISRPNVVILFSWCRIPPDMNGM